jgi:hypothetical protein
MGNFGVFLKDDIQRHNALKNLLAGVINLVAAVVFVVIDNKINWAAAGRPRSAPSRAVCSARGSDGGCHPTFCVG